MKCNSYLIHYRSYQCANNEKQVPYSTRGGLENNNVLQFMECLTPTVSFNLFTDNYFTYFRLFICLPNPGVSNIQARCVFNKNSSRKNIINGENNCKKRNVITFNSAAHIKQKHCEICVAG